MARAHIHQIFYSEATRAALDPGFMPLDNLANPRPDWREYWPMRAHLLADPPAGEDFRGYFSPKFGAKTGLDAAGVEAFVEAHGTDCDVILFSPFFDQVAAYWSIFEQAVSHHPGMEPVLRQSAALIAPGVDLATLATDSRNTVYSNFFVARPAFWRAWLAANETLFAIAESGEGELARRLNAEVVYGKVALPAKIFVMERMATLLLATGTWKVAARNPILSPVDSLFHAFRLELLCMDALKIAHAQSPGGEYRHAFRFLQGEVKRRSREAAEARAAVRAAEPPRE